MQEADPKKLSRSRSRSKSKSKENRAKIIRWDPPSTLKRWKDPRLDILEERSQLIPKRGSNSRLFLVLDLDETLVSLHDNGKEPLIINGGSKDKKYEPRSHLTSFLEEVNNYYELFIYSHGEKAYVQAVVNKLCSHSSMIRPEFYASEGDVTSQTRKNLLKLNITNTLNKQFTLEELLTKTLIIDDTFGVWEDSHEKNLIVSKKFFPFKESKLEFEKVKNGFSISKTIQLDINLKPCYIERDLPTPKKGQLYYLKDLLVKLAKLYYCKRKLKRDPFQSIQEVLAFEQRRILACKNVFFFNFTANSNGVSLNYNSLRELIKFMGGEVFVEDAVFTSKYSSKNKKLDYFLINTFEMQKSEEVVKQRCLRTIENLKKNNKLIFPVVTEAWLIDSYFFCTALPAEDYIFKDF